MPRSRADEILQAWDGAARDVQRPPVGVRHPRGVRGRAGFVPRSATVGGLVLASVGIAIAAALVRQPSPAPGTSGTPHVGARAPTASASGAAASSPASVPSVPSEGSITAPPTGSPGASTPAVGPTVWGPLAVIGPDDGSDMARIEGTLRITADCVLLDNRGELVLLLWNSDEVFWDAASRTITFTNWDGSRAFLRDGDAVVLGGGAGSEAESGVSQDVWFSQLDWVAQPSPTCPRDPSWGVGHAEVVPPNR